MRCLLSWNHLSHAVNFFHYKSLLGKSVFEGKDVREVVEKNKLCEIDYEFKQYPFVSPLIKDLLKGMLAKTPS